MRGCRRAQAPGGQAAALQVGGCVCLHCCGRSCCTLRLAKLQQCMLHIAAGQAATMHPHTHPDPRQTQRKKTRPREKDTNKHKSRPLQTHPQLPLAAPCAAPAKPGGQALTHHAVRDHARHGGAAGHPGSQRVHERGQVGGPAQGRAQGLARAGQRGASLQPWGSRDLWSVTRRQMREC